MKRILLVAMVISFISIKVPHTIWAQSPCNALVSTMLSNNVGEPGSSWEIVDLKLTSTDFLSSLDAHATSLVGSLDSNFLLNQNL